MLKILTVPVETEILRTKSQPVEKFDAELVAFLKELGETLKNQKDPAGVGLSAIQVGKAIRAFATWLPLEKIESAPHQTYFSPEASSLALAKSVGAGFGRTSGFLQGKNPGPSEKTEPELIFYINPEITEHATEMTLGYDLVKSSKFKVQSPNQPINASTHQPFLEGCLSIPRIYGPVMRWSWTEAETIIISESQLQLISKIKNQKSKIRLDGLHSRVFQHEVDHLNGILFTDHVLAQGNQLYREEGREMVAMEM